jgi:hypothetical protein
VFFPTSLLTGGKDNGSRQFWLSVSLVPGTNRAGGASRLTAGTPRAQQSTHARNAVVFGQLRKKLLQLNRDIPAGGAVRILRPAPGQCAVQKTFGIDKNPVSQTGLLSVTHS